MHVLNLRINTNAHKQIALEFTVLMTFNVMLLQWQKKIV